MRFEEGLQVSIQWVPAAPMFRDQTTVGLSSWYWRQPLGAGEPASALVYADGGDQPSRDGEARVLVTG